MKVFADANILVAVLNKEYPVFSYAARVLSLNDTPRFQIYTSSVCLAIAFYFAEKKSSNRQARKKMGALCDNIQITDCGRKEVLQAAGNTRIHDFEDGLEYYSAIDAGCKCIVTEDKADFYFSEVEILSAREFLAKYL